MVNTIDIKGVLSKAYTILDPYSKKYNVDFDRYLFSLQCILEIENIGEKKILDIGTGIGLLPMALTECGVSIEGADYFVFPEHDNDMFGVPSMDILQDVWKKNNLIVHNCNIYSGTLPWEDNNFDVIISEATIEHVKDPKKFIDRCYQLLKPGGYVILTTPNISTLLKRIRFIFGKSPLWPVKEFYEAGENFTGHWREYTMDELVVMCELSKFEVVHTYNKNLLTRFKKLSSWKKNIRAFVVLLSTLVPGSKEMNYIICKKVHKKNMINVSEPIIEQEEIDAVNSVLRSGMLAQGPKVKELEENFAEYCGTKYAVAFTNGTAALHGGLAALGVNKEDEVITSPFTFVATANAVLMQGAKLIFSDISEDDFCLDPEAVKEKITDKTKAIIPVDIYGQVYKYDEMKKIAEEKKIKILEDACQAIGAEQNGQKAGTFGDAAAFSLYATKNIMSGEGGMIVTDDLDVAEKCRRFRHHGQSQKQYEYVDLGYNYRMTDLCASIGVEQLKKADKFNSNRRKNAERLLEGLGGIKGLLLPIIKDNNNHVFHQFTIRITEEFKTSRQEFMDYLKSHGVGCGVYYPKPLHLHPHFMDMGYKKGDFPVSERMSEQVLSLPVHPSLSDENMDYIIKVIRDYVR